MMGSSGARFCLIATASLLLTAGAAAQPMPECRQAKTEADKAICGNPELAAADKRMAEAYAAFRAQLPPEQQKALLADQRRWITRRQAACGDKSADALVQCLIGETESRRRLLAGEGPNGAPGAPRIVAGLFHEARKGRYEISIEYPQVLTPHGPATTAFERAAHAIAFGKAAVAEYREMEPPHATGAENFYDATYAVSYLDSRLVSLVFTISTFTGGAHPNSGRTSLIFDLAAGRELSLADLVADPKRATDEIAARCRAKAEKEDWGLFDDPDFPAVVGDVATWAPDKDGVVILFDPYSVAPYVAGLHECRLSYAELAPLLKSGGPLPPQQGEPK
jgi:uncharacterized protein YecT (DUF1311 family)